MRFKFTFILLALNILVFALIVLLERRAERAGDAESGLAAQFGQELLDADRLELRGRGLSSPRILRRDGADWELVEPMRWSANFFAVNRILNQLQFLEAEASFSVDEIAATGQSLADYGLEDPLLTLTIAEGEQTFSVSIGTLTEVGNNIYLLGPSEDRIFVVEREVIDGLLVDLNDLRTRKLFDIPVFEVGTLSLQIRSETAGNGGMLKVRLARTDGSWSFEAPLSAQADPALVETTINSLTAANVGRFIDDAAADPILQGLENPFMRVTIHGNQREQTVVLGNLDPDASGTPQYFAQLEGNPAVFTVPAEPFDALREAQDALRERNFLDFQADEISALRIADDDRVIRLQRLEGGEAVWQVLESREDAEIQSYRADRAVMQGLLEDLQTLQATGFAVDAPSPADLERLGFGQPRRVVTLDRIGAEPLVLTLAHPETDNSNLYAKTAQADFIYQVERRPTLQMLPLNTLDYRNRTLETLPAAAVISTLQLTDLSTGEDLVDIRLPDGVSSWDSYLLENEMARLDALRTLLDSVRQFRVDALLRDQFDPQAYPVDAESTLPWQYQLSATIELPGGEVDRTVTHRYLFTERLSGTVQVGASPRHDLSFQIAQPLIDALFELSPRPELPPEALGDPIPEADPVPALDALDASPLNSAPLEE
jgi:hypothetical protein